MSKSTTKHPSARVVQVWGGAAIKIAPILVIATVLSGCTGTIARGKAIGLQNQGYPPGFVTGYEDGCQAGYVAAGHVWATSKQDMSRYNTDADYHKGWNNGFESCKESYLRTRRELR